jgi:hypothetical protein
VSVAIALAMEAFGLVMTDGRRVESGGCAIRDDYDKTFAIANPRLIGASVGLLEFNGLCVAQHVQQIVDAGAGQLTSLQTACRDIGRRLAERLGNISEAEVGFQHRKLELLFVGKCRLTSGYARICSVELNPDCANHRIDQKVKLWEPADYYVTVGDDLARARIRSRMPRPERRFLFGDIARARRRLTEVMTEAIAHCGPHPLYPNIPACGGLPHMREMEVAEP